jgi:hypothetical protein
MMVFTTDTTPMKTRFEYSRQDISHTQFILTSLQHQPGTEHQHSAPTSHLQTFSPGTAPAERSFAANPRPQDMGFDDPTRDPLDFEGSGKPYTSLDADRGEGKPISGQSSHELRHDGKDGSKHDRSGLAGLKGTYEDKLADKEDHMEKRK